MIVGNATGTAQSTSGTGTFVNLYVYWRGVNVTSDVLVYVPDNSTASGKIYFNAVVDAGGLSAGSFVVYGSRSGGFNGSVSCSTALTEFKR